jgi:hypothetical protein
VSEESGKANVECWQKTTLYAFFTAIGGKEEFGCFKREEHHGD